MRLNIKFLQADGTTSNDPAGIPVVDVALEVDRSSEANSGRVFWLQKCLALIDTGADHNYVEETFSLPKNWTLLGTARVEGATSTVQGRHYKAEIMLTETLLAFTSNFFTTPLRKNNRKYDVVLGRLFLSQGKLVMDYPKQLFFFEL